MKVDSLKNKHVRLMHSYNVEGGQVVSKRIFGGGEIDDKTYKNLMKWKSEGKIPEKVWVTPKIPFLIPITLGLIVAVVYGDILMQIISFFIVALSPKCKWPYAYTMVSKKPDPSIYLDEMRFLL